MTRSSLPATSAVRARRARRAGGRARARRRRAGAARRRRLDLGRLRTRGRRSAGSTCWRRSSRRAAIATAWSTRRSPATRPPAGRARMPALLQQHRPAVVVVELGGNDALRGGNLLATRANLDSIVKDAQAAGAKVLVAGMQLPPNYGPAYVRQFNALFADVAKARKAALVPYVFDGFGDDLSQFQPDRIHPTAAAQAEDPRQRVADAGHAAAEMTAVTLPPGPPPRPDGARRRRAHRRVLRAHRRALAVRIRRGPRPRRSQPAGARRRRARAGRHDVRAGVGVRRAQARRRDRRAQHRADRRDVRARQAARMGTARLLLARRAAQPRADARADRDRLARAAARRRIPRVPPPRRRDARDAAAALRLSA